MIKNPITNTTYKYGYTHSGVFHADEVFSTAMLRMIDPEFIIQRGFNPPQDEDILVYDLSCSPEFDHHTDPREARENGVIYAAFGKLWRVFAPVYFGKEVADRLDAKLVQEIDAVDNGMEGSQSNISRVIHELNPLWDKNEDNEKQFWLAVAIAKQILAREIASAESTIKARDVVDDAMNNAEDPRLLVLDYYVPWNSHIIKKYPDVQFAIFPSPRGGFSMQVIPVAENTTVPRLDVPEAWKSYTGKDKNNNPEPPRFEGMTFCHATGFISNFKTKEQAIAAAKYIMDRR